ncbi:MAG: type II toxin-antitoxin system VapC family toxin [Methylovulum sp.]|uniref:type II toxin-antitoxin system VapC family toxin n=1 Tax=Methylovulum sp. TaxID=1916980 RepID=UPI00260CD434|nr:type II toxin-antitoxin system VapC family toxin [Methylovulum sp.]MDD2723592.1 type II toxin-antitoxin system VapC family toxin [Methylovulum sp.]MDD5126132.1 type II toxin-antitoxin system VapC family toxin [Methylovulum sp.]
MILDASALLAYLQQEQGCLLVEHVLPVAFMSTVNWCEVVQKLHARSIDDKAIYKNLEILGLRFVAFNMQHADTAGELWPMTAPFGLSLGDRACLATGLIEKMPIMTADKIWQNLPLSLEIQLIR